jgi:hypothetical protein
MSASRRGTDARRGDGRTTPDDELTQQATLQKEVLDLLRFGRKANFTGSCIISMLFERGALKKCHSTVRFEGMDKLGPKPAHDEGCLHTDLQRVAIDLLKWGSTGQVFGEAAMEMVFDRGKFQRVIRTMTKKELVTPKAA